MNKIVRLSIYAIIALWILSMCLMVLTAKQIYHERSAKKDMMIYKE